MKQGNSSGDKDKELQQLKAQNQQLNEKLKKQTLAGNAAVVELVDTLDLGSSAQAWGFESLLRHQFNSYTHIQLKIKALSEPISYFPSRVSIKIKGSDVSPSLTDEKIYMMCGKKDISIGTERSINIKADCELTANYTFDSVPYNLYRGTSPSYELIDLGFSSPLKVEFEQYRDFNH
jgi:hypothetical protein